MPATKDEIAAAFGELALRYGYRRASVDDVARALRISKQTIYEHFRTKEELYRYYVELWARGQRARVESALTETSALGRIAEVTRLAFADARQSLAGGSYADATEPPEIMAEVNSQVFVPLVRDLIVQGNEAGEFSVADPETTAAFVVAVGTEAVRMLLENPASRPDDAALDAIRRLVAGVVE